MLTLLRLPCPQIASVFIRLEPTTCRRRNKTTYASRGRPQHSGIRRSGSRMRSRVQGN
jgi:hypothetical protein